MKIRTVLSGIAALLLVGTFYSFAFCMVEDVNDEPVSMEYYYSTETDADTGERNGEATSAFDASLGNDTNHEEDSNQNSGSAAAAVPTDYTESFTFKNPLPDKFSDGSEDETADNKNSDASADAKNASVFADNNQDDGRLSKLDDNDDDDVIVVTTIPEEAEPDEVVAAILEDDIIEDDEDEPEYSDNTYVSDISAVSVSDVIVKVIESDAQQEDAPEDAEDTSSSDPVSVSGETFTARYNGSVHTVDAFDLVCMIVNNEISTYFSDEAIKAQAVAAYSYVKYHNVNGLTPSVLVKSNPPQRIIDLVSSVWGKCCYYNGEVAQTVYMASSSGYTASSSNVWGGKIDYLVSVACPFDAESDPNYGTQTKFSESTIRSALENSLGITLSDNPENWFTITDYVDGNYVSKINIDGQTSITGKKLRESILNYQLKSASFSVSYSDGYFTFTTYGYGHGVGMSQNGANILAKQGYTYDQILKYYYTGIDVI